MQSTICRHCTRTTFDTKTNASVLVTGGVEGFASTVADLESRIVPCVSAVCPTCERISILSSGTTESLLCTVYMWQRLKEWIDTASEENDST